MMNSSLYHQIAKTTAADRLLAAEHARTLRAIRPAHKHSFRVGLRGVIVARRVRVLARLRVA
jgi:hypothetical protein